MNKKNNESNYYHPTNDKKHYFVVVRTHDFNFGTMKFRLVPVTSQHDLPHIIIATI